MSIESSKRLLKNFMQNTGTNHQLEKEFIKGDHPVFLTDLQTDIREALNI